MEDKVQTVQGGSNVVQKQVPQTPEPLVVKGVVVKTGPIFALVSILAEDGGRCGKFVSIRVGNHQTMKIAIRQKHGVIFTGTVTPREPGLHESVYIQVARIDARESIAWAGSNEGVTIHPQVIKVVTRSLKKRPFAVKLAERRLKEHGIDAVVVAVPA